jgi:hypothetical protein
VEVEAFIARHPQLFHMAEEGAWDGIREHGLLSTTALLDLYQYDGEARVAIESRRRSEIVTIRHPRTGVPAQIRDNKPLRLQFLEECLTDMTVQGWCELLNRKVFFWVSEDRLAKLLSARAYKNRAHDVITIDTRALVERELPNITLAPINTGATLYPTATKRGSDTFVSIPAYPLADYIKWRGHENAIVELAVDYKVDRVDQLAVRAERRHQEEVLEVLWIAR